MKSWPQRICTLALVAILVACAGAQQSHKVVRLPSGKEIKVLGVGQIHFSEGEPALMLKYQTELHVDDKPALQHEIDEIWPRFKQDVENAHLSAAIISANEPPRGGFISTNRSFNFVFEKAADGTWVQK
jgi:hypothetical protein